VIEDQNKGRTGGDDRGIVLKKKLTLKALGVKSGEKNQLGKGGEGGI